MNANIDDKHYVELNRNHLASLKILTDVMLPKVYEYVFFKKD
jgi:hypothetical protein